MHIFHDGHPGYVAHVVQLTYMTRNYLWQARRLTCVYGMQISRAFVHKHARSLKILGKSYKIHACVKFKLGCLESAEWNGILE